MEVLISQKFYAYSHIREAIGRLLSTSFELQMLSAQNNTYVKIAYLWVCNFDPIYWVSLENWILRDNFMCIDWDLDYPCNNVFNETSHVCIK